MYSGKVILYYIEELEDMKQNVNVQSAVDNERGRKWNEEKIGWVARLESAGRRWRCKIKKAATNRGEWLQKKAQLKLLPGAGERFRRNSGRSRDDRQPAEPIGPWSGNPAVLDVQLLHKPGAPDHRNPGHVCANLPVIGWQVSHARDTANAHLMPRIRPVHVCVFVRFPSFPLFVVVAVSAIFAPPAGDTKHSYLKCPQEHVHTCTLTPLLARTYNDTCMQRSLDKTLYRTNDCNWQLNGNLLNYSASTHSAACPPTPISLFSRLLSCYSCTPSKSKFGLLNFNLQALQIFNMNNAIKTDSSKSFDL